MKATVYFPPADMQREAFFFEGQALVAGAYRAGLCVKGPIVTLPEGLRGVAAADELFDLSNNPGRQDDREKEYGRGRSLSVGDIVEVNGEAWQCKSVGWERVA